MGISTQGLRSKSLEAFRGQSFDFVITLCNKAQAECQSLPGAGKFIAWDFEDPTTSDKSDAFMKTLHEIQERIKMFVLVNEKT